MLHGKGSNDSILPCRAAPGGDAFLKWTQKLSDKAAIDEIPRVQGRPMAKQLSHYRDKLADASTGMLVIHATEDYTMQGIADCLMFTMRR